MSRAVRFATVHAVALVLALPAVASEPGQPLDCSDFVAIAPGFSCSVYSASGNLDWRPWMMDKGTNAAWLRDPIS